MSKIKRCPWCDSIAEIDDGPEWRVVCACPSCEARGPKGYDEKEAVDQWNWLSEIAKEWGEEVSNE